MYGMFIRLGIHTQDSSWGGCVCVYACVQFNREGAVQEHQRTQLFYLIVLFDSTHSVAL